MNAPHPALVVAVDEQDAVPAAVCVAVARAVGSGQGVVVVVVVEVVIEEVEDDRDRHQRVERDVENRVLERHVRAERPVGLHVEDRRVRDDLADDLEAELHKQERADQVAALRQHLALGERDHVDLGHHDAQDLAEARRAEQEHVAANDRLLFLLVDRVVVIRDLRVKVFAVIQDRHRRERARREHPADHHVRLPVGAKDREDVGAEAEHEAAGPGHEQQQLGRVHLVLLHLKLNLHERQHAALEPRRQQARERHGHEQADVLAVQKRHLCICVHCRVATAAGIRIDRARNTETDAAAAAAVRVTIQNPIVERSMGRLVHCHLQVRLAREFTVHDPRVVQIARDAHVDRRCAEQRRHGAAGVRRGLERLTVEVAERRPLRVHVARRRLHHRDRLGLRAAPAHHHRRVEGSRRFHRHRLPMCLRPLTRGRVAVNSDTSPQTVVLRVS